MDFRTEWSSWVLLLLMIVISVIVNPYQAPEIWSLSSGGIYVLRILAIPFLAVTLTCFPVLLVCWMIKIIPDIDYSIRLAFILLVIYYMMHQY